MSLERDLPTVGKMMVEGIVGSRGGMVRGEKPWSQRMTRRGAAVAFIRQEDRGQQGRGGLITAPGTTTGIVSLSRWYPPPPKRHHLH